MLVQSSRISELRLRNLNGLEQRTWWEKNSGTLAAEGDGGTQSTNNVLHSVTQPGNV